MPACGAGQRLRFRLCVSPVSLGHEAKKAFRGRGGARTGKDGKVKSTGRPHLCVSYCAYTFRFVWSRIVRMLTKQPMSSTLDRN